MSGIINSGQFVGARFSEPKEAPKVEQKLTWSVTDTIKHMIYSALSGIAPQWSTKKLSNLHAKYNPPIDPNFAKREVEKAVARLCVLTNRADMFLLDGVFAEKVLENLNIPKEKAIDLLIKDDSLWPQGDPSIIQLSRHIYQGRPEPEDKFIRKCRAILKPHATPTWTKEIEERLEARTGNRRAGEKNFRPLPEFHDHTPVTMKTLDAERIKQLYGYYPRQI